MKKNNSVQRIGMLRKHNALLNERLRLEKKISVIKQQLAELEAAIYLESQSSPEERTWPIEIACQIALPLGSGSF